jgi:outer membrane protein OmpA-like peptidoglycan-associated protein
MQRFSVLLLFALTAAADPVETTPNRLGELRFESGSASLETMAQQRAIEDAARWLAEHPDRMLFIEGHTDRRGSWSANVDLSHQRAAAVRDELLRAGVDPMRLIVVARSESEPVAGGPAANRRVVLYGTAHSYADMISPSEARAPRDSEPARREPEARRSDPRN